MIVIWIHLFAKSRKQKQTRLHD